MTTIGALVTKSQYKTGDTAKPIVARDPLLVGANGGVLFNFDLAFPFSYPGGYSGTEGSRPAAAAPTNGQAIYDISGYDINGSLIAGHANGQAVLASTAPTYAGGGFDFSAVPVAANGAYVEAPASVSAALYATQGSANPQYIICGYFKLSALADWITESNIVANIIGMGGYNSVAVLGEVQIAQQSSSIRGVCQTGTGSTAQFNIAVPPSYNDLAQIALYRTNGGNTVLRVKTAGGVVLANLGTTATPQNYSVSTIRWGMSTFWNAGNTSEANARKFRLYRGFVENLVTSGRDPATVLDDDWTRIQARIAAGIAAFS